MSVVRVTDGKKTFMMPVKNCKLKIKTLGSYFNGAIGLTYTKNNEKYSVDVDEDDSLILPPNVQEYDVFYPEPTNKMPIEANNEALSERKRNIMAIINNEPIGNFKTPQSLSLKKKEDLKPKKNSTKTIFILWKHKHAGANKFKLMSSSATQKFFVDERRDYSFDEIKVMALSAVKDTENRSFFESSSIKLGDCAEKCLCEEFFIDELGNKCNFWDFAPVITGSNRQKKLYIFTEKNNSIDKNNLKPTESVRENIQEKFGIHDSSFMKLENFKEKFPAYEDENIDSIDKNENIILNQHTQKVHKEAAVNKNKIDNSFHLNADYRISDVSLSKPSVKSQKQSDIYKEDMITKKPMNSLDNFANYIRSKTSHIAHSYTSQDQNDNSACKPKGFFNSVSSLLSCSGKRKSSGEDTLPSHHSKKIKLIEAKSDCTDSQAGASCSDVSKFKYKPGKIYQLGNDSGVDYYSGVNLNDLDLSVPVIKPSNIERELQLFTKQKVGKGGFGYVVKGIWRQTEVAVKIMKLKIEEKSVFREIGVMEKLRHPSIISLMAVGKFKYWYLVMEYFESNNLHEILFEQKNPMSSFDVKMKNHIGFQIVKVIGFLHESDIYHKDIKPSNVLVNKYGVVKLCDFGLSRFKEMPKELETVEGFNIKGTYMFMSPEILSNKKAKKPADVWAVAILLFELYNEKEAWDFLSLNFELPKAYGFLKLIQEKKIPDLDKVPAELHKCLIDCLKFNPEERCKIQSVIDAYVIITKNEIV